MAGVEYDLNEVRALRAAAGLMVFRVDDDDVGVKLKTHFLCFAREGAEETTAQTL